MLFLVLWLSLAVVFICLAVIGYFRDWDESPAVLATIGVVFAVILVIALIGLPISHTVDTGMFETRVKLVERIETPVMSEEEHAQLVLDVNAFNDDLLHKQTFYPRNRLWFGWYHNEEILTLEPVVLP
jgi:glucan phosphoethanolaminetransferase (alkaline phosphatase superfamily)